MDNQSYHRYHAGIEGSMGLIQVMGQVKAKGQDGSSSMESKSATALSRWSGEPTECSRDRQEMNCI
jgi:hypothetical protein